MNRPTVVRVDPRQDVAWQEFDEAKALALYESAEWPVQRSDGALRMGLGAGWVALVFSHPDALERLVGVFGPLPDAPELVLPGSNALRARLYRSPETPTAIDLHGAWPGVSVWGAGRTLVVPPGVAGGHEVRWRKGRAPAPSMELPALPTWLADITRDPIVARASVEKAGRASTDLPCTDLGNAERLAQRHGLDLRWCEDWGTWLVWTGRHWERDKMGEVSRRAFDTVREIAREGAECDHDARRKSLLKHAIASESAGRLDAMVRIARAQPGIASMPDLFDTGHWDLPCANGTVSLRTGELRPSRREDLSTRSLDLEWDPAAACPLWLRFLEDVQPDPEVRAFLQRWAGYAATGVIREHVFVIHHGTGRNGKGVFMNALLHVLGDYARQIPTDLLMEKHGSAHPVDKMTLRGLRLASASETDQGAKLATTVVKALTGGDMVSARGMRENFTEWEPTHKVALQTNPKPVIREQSPAIRERLILVPWSVFMPPERRDLELGTKLKAEAPGILRWVVEGCLGWQQYGLSPPAAVRLATAQYFDEQDSVGQFLAERCTSDPIYAGAVVRENATTLYKAFTGWCEEQGRKPETQTVFGGALEDRGFEKLKQGTVFRLGLRLLSDDERLNAGREEGT